MRGMYCVGARHGAWLVMLVGMASILSSCANPTSPEQIGQKEAQGNQIGTLVGSMAAYIPGGGSVAAQIIQSHGSTIGGMVGGAIGAALDEEDRQALDRATRAAFVSGQKKTFTNSKTGVRGSATVTSNTKNASGQPCRTVKQEAILPDGKVLNNTVSACKGANDWEV